MYQPRALLSQGGQSLESADLEKEVLLTTTGRGSDYQKLFSFLLAFDAANAMQR